MICSWFLLILYFQPFKDSSPWGWFLDDFHFVIIVWRLLRSFFFSLFMGFLFFFFVFYYYDLVQITLGGSEGKKKFYHFNSFLFLISFCNLKSLHIKFDPVFLFRANFNNIENGWLTTVNFVLIWVVLFPAWQRSKVCIAME